MRDDEGILSASILERQAQTVCLERNRGGNPQEDSARQSQAGTTSARIYSAKGQKKQWPIRKVI
jgi:hypothetical protein